MGGARVWPYLCVTLQKVLGLRATRPAAPRGTRGSGQPARHACALQHPNVPCSTQLTAGGHDCGKCMAWTRHALLWKRPWDGSRGGNRRHAAPGGRAQGSPAAGHAAHPQQAALEHGAAGRVPAVARKVHRAVRFDCSQRSGKGKSGSAHGSGDMPPICTRQCGGGSQASELAWRGSPGRWRRPGQATY